MKTTYIITGANGFLGNNIIRKLQDKDNVELRALILPNDPVKSLNNVKCKIYYGDVTKIETLKEIFDIDEEGRVIVIHCAAIVDIKSKNNPLMYEVNVNGTNNIIKKTLEIDAKLIYVSSVHAIPEKRNKKIMSEIKIFNPENVYGAYAKSKAQTANNVLRAVKNDGLKAVILHPSGIIGPGDFGSSHLTQLIIDTSNGSLKASVNGGYDFVDVRDVVNGIISASEIGVVGECYILSNKFVLVKDILNIVSEIENTKKIKTILPMWLAIFTAPLAEMYYKIKRQVPLYTKYSLYTVSANGNFSHQKATEELGYNPRDFHLTIKDTIEWLKEQDRI